MIQEELLSLVDSSMLHLFLAVNELTAHFHLSPISSKGMARGVHDATVILGPK